MRVETAASWDGEYRFGFVANSDDRNKVDIAEKICVGCKGEFNIGICGIEYIPHSDIRK